MNYTITNATEQDFPDILELEYLLADTEGGREKVKNTVSLMQQEKNYFHAFIARSDTGEAIGMIIYYFSYSISIGKTLFVNALYVKEEWRKNGIGKALFDSIMAVANKKSCKRIHLQAFHWNTSTIQWYERLGAKVDNEMIDCKFWI